MTIAFFGSSLVSAYWNGAATYYRGILRELAARGHRLLAGGLRTTTPTGSGRRRAAAPPSRP